MLCRLSVRLCKLMNIQMLVVRLLNRLSSQPNSSSLMLRMFFFSLSNSVSLKLLSCVYFLYWLFHVIMIGWKILKNVQSFHVGYGKSLVGPDQVLCLIYTGEINLPIKRNLEPRSEWKKKFILMICMRFSSGNKIELFGTVGLQNLDRLEVVLLVLMVLLTITLLLISLHVEKFEFWVVREK